MNPAEVDGLWSRVAEVCQLEKRAKSTDTDDLRAAVRLLLATPDGRLRIQKALEGQEPLAGKLTLVRELVEAVSEASPPLPEPYRKTLLVLLTRASQGRATRDVTYWQVLHMRAIGGDLHAGRETSDKLLELLGREKAGSLGRLLTDAAWWAKVPSERRIGLLEFATRATINPEAKAQVQAALDAARNPAPASPAEPPKPAVVPSPVPPPATVGPPKAESPKPEPAAAVPAPAVAEPAPPKAPREPKAKPEPAKPEPAAAGTPAGAFSAAGVELDEMARKIEVLYRRSEEDQARQAAERDKLARRVAELEADAERAEADHRAESDGLKAERDAAQEKAGAATRRAEEAEGRIEAERRRAEQAVHDGRLLGETTAATDRAELWERLKRQFADIPEADLASSPAASGEQFLLDKLRAVRRILRERGVPPG